MDVDGYGWIWVDMDGYGWVWEDMGGCGWKCKETEVKPHVYVENVKKTLAKP